MNGVAILLLAATIGVEYSWQTTPTGEVEYFVQMEPTILDSLAQGEVIHSDVPPEVGVVDRLVVRISATKQTAAMVTARAARMPNFNVPPARPGTVPIAEVPSALYRPQSPVEDIQAISFGWQPNAQGEQEYYVQIEPTLLRTLAEGDELYMPIRIEAGKVARFVILSGKKELPRIAAKPKAGSLPGTSTTGTTSNLPRTNLQIPGVDAPALVNSQVPGTTRSPTGRMPVPPGSTDPSTTITGRTPLSPPDDTASSRNRSPFTPSAGFGSPPASSPYSGTELASNQNYPTPPDSPTDLTTRETLGDVAPPRFRTGDQTTNPNLANGGMLDPPANGGLNGAYPAPPVGTDTNLYPPLNSNSRPGTTQPGYGSTAGSYDDPRNVRPVGASEPIAPQPGATQPGFPAPNAQPPATQYQPQQPPVGQQPPMGPAPQPGYQQPMYQQPGYQQPAAPQLPPAQYPQQPIYVASNPPITQTQLPTPPAATETESKSKTKEEAELPVVPLLLTSLGLMLSIGGNLYLAWVAAEFYSRYRLAVERVRSVSR